MPGAWLQGFRRRVFEVRVTLDYRTRDPRRARSRNNLRSPRLCQAAIRQQGRSLTLAVRKHRTATVQASAVAVDHWSEPGSRRNRTELRQCRKRQAHSRFCAEVSDDVATLRRKSTSADERRLWTHCPLTLVSARDQNGSSWTIFCGIIAISRIICAVGFFLALAEAECRSA